MTTTAPEFVVTKAATDPNPPKRPRDLTPADHLVIDGRSIDAKVLTFIDAKCVDCGNLVHLASTHLGEANEDGDYDVVPVCVLDQGVRDAWAAIDAQHEIEMAKRRARSREPKSFFSQARAAAANGVPVTVVAQPVSSGPANTRKSKKQRVKGLVALGVSKDAAKRMVNS